MKAPLAQRVAAEAIGTAFLLAAIIGSGIMGERLAAAIDGEIEWRDVAPYVVAQVVFAFVGVAAAHLMFSEPLFSASVRIRTGPPQWFSEFVAAFGLVVVILGCARRNAAWTPVAVAGYIGAAYWFTSSTSFANPAVTLARSASNTFAGVRPDDVAGFVAAQLAGAITAVILMRWISPKAR